MPSTRLILSPGDTAWTIPATTSEIEVFGTGGADQITISQGAKVTLSGFSSGDTINLSDGLGSFTVRSSGATAFIEDDKGTVVSFALSTTPTTVNFGGTSFEASIGTKNGVSGLFLGDQKITTSAETVTTSPVNADITEKSIDGLGTTDTAVTLSAKDGNFLFTDDVSTANNVFITDFTSGDILKLSGGTYSVANNGEDVSINHNGAAGLSSITLVGAVDSSDVISYSAFQGELKIGTNLGISGTADFLVG